MCQDILQWCKPNEILQSHVRLAGSETDRNEKLILMVIVFWNIAEKRAFSVTPNWYSNKAPEAWPALWIANVVNAWRIHQEFYAPRVIVERLNVSSPNSEKGERRNGRFIKFVVTDYRAAQPEMSFRRRNKGIQFTSHGKRGEILIASVPFTNPRRIH